MRVLVAGGVGRVSPAVVDRLLAPHRRDVLALGQHTDSALLEGPLTEFKAEDVDWWPDLVLTRRPNLEDGTIALPKGPGLGIVRNDATAGTRLSPGTSFFE